MAAIHSLLKSVDPDVHLQQAIADFLRLDAGEPGRLPHSPESQKTHGADSGSEVQVLGHRWRNLERIPRC